MRHILATALLCLLSASLATCQQSGTDKPLKPKAKTDAASATSSVADQIKKLEQAWAQATMKDGVAAVDQYEADDILSTDPTGRVTDKAQDKMDLSSGDLRFQSMDLSDLRVRVYGNTAVATGVNTLKGTYKGQAIDGRYRFTDTWVERNGKWQVVATQGTKVLQ
ncbi:MAG TPA: nuclear transport factor 2 family protein [Thermoanaerobaculia bacterium]|nr:nuclear transport factor 2 family protein [Thermoanaerobaculia bacterium]